MKSILQQKYILKYMMGNSQVYKSAIYEDVSKSNKAIRFKFIEEISPSGQIPYKQDLVFFTKNGYKMKDLMEAFYPNKEGIPHWFEKYD